MIKATIQRTPYCTEMTFPCTETQLSTWLDELRMNPEHLCPAATITQIEPAELSVLEDCEVSLDALNYLAKRMDGYERIMSLRGKTLCGAKPILCRADLRRIGHRVGDEKHHQSHV